MSPLIVRLDLLVYLRLGEFGFESMGPLVSFAISVPDFSGSFASGQVAGEIDSWPPAWYHSRSNSIARCEQVPTGLF